MSIQRNFTKVDSDNLQMTETVVTNITRSEIVANITAIEVEISSLETRLNKYNQALALLNS